MATNDFVGRDVALHNRKQDNLEGLGPDDVPDWA